MPEITIQPESVSTVAEDNIDLHEIGIEFEFPYANAYNGYDDIPERYQYASTSSSYRDTYGRGVSLEFGGQMTSDHVGAEVTSDVMNLHTEEPLEWYTDVIADAEEKGYPFAYTGQGQTNFGLHMHLSTLTEEKARALYEMVENNRYTWPRVFFCSSVKPRSADPWRHGGIRYGYGFDQTSILRPCRRGSVGHYEFRLPEPMPPEQLELVLEFLQLLEHAGPEAAEHFARERVANLDERLAPIDQYEFYRDEWEGDFLDTIRNTPAGDRPRSDHEAEEFLMELMGDA